MYGPITTLRRNATRVTKHIPWTAFKMLEQDWQRVVDAHDILWVRIPHHFLKLKLIDNLGFQSHSRILLGRQTAHSLACPPCSGRAAISLGGQAGFSKVRYLQGCSR